MPTLDAELNAVSLDYPGFKGIIGADNGTEAIVLTSEPSPSATLQRSATTDQAGLTRALAERLGLEPARLTFAEPVAARRADGMATPAERPDFHVLYDVKTGLRRFMFEADLATSLDLDEETGRVIVGTENAAQEEEVRASMTPDELANTDFIRALPDEPFVSEPSVGSPSASSSSVSLRSVRTSRFRPLLGGARTDFSSPLFGASSCTQGPVVQYRGSTYGFLSNAHCTFSRSRIDRVKFSQPFDTTAIDFVGIEEAEPAYRSGRWITDGYYSDVAFVRTNAAVQLRGQVARTGECAIGSVDCVEMGSPIDITGSASYVLSGSILIKVGKETGTTRGRLATTCIDLAQDGDKLLCQNRVRWGAYDFGTRDLATFGDSGSPVFLSGGTLGSITTAQVVGILWGGSGADPSYFNYSPWENIWQRERAGTAYGLPVEVVTVTRGLVSNTTVIIPPTGGGGGGGSPLPCPDGTGGEGGFRDDEPACTPPSP